MFRFENEIYLYGLLIIPILVLLFIGVMAWRKQAKRKFGHSKLVHKLAPDTSNGKHMTKFILACLALTFLVLGLANPQVGTKLEETKRKGIDIFIALDVSRSMLAEDIKPSRLERTKRAIGQLTDRLGEDRIGMIVFAGEAYLQLPLTNDFSAVKMFLETTSTEDIPTQGTAIGDAIELATNSFPEEQKEHKALLIFSDGENLQGDALEATKKAAKQGIVIHTIGIGTPSGSPIPIKRYGQRVDFHRNEQGEVVVTKLDESTLRQVADVGEGDYIQYTGGRNDLKNILQTLGAMKKKEFEAKVYTDYADNFQYCIGAALFFLILELFVSERRAKWFDQFFKTEQP